MEENIVKSLTLPTGGEGGSSSPEFMMAYDNNYRPSFRPPTGTIEPGTLSSKILMVYFEYLKIL